MAQEAAPVEVAVPAGSPGADARTGREADAAQQDADAGTTGTSAPPSTSPAPRAPEAAPLPPGRPAPPVPLARAAEELAARMQIVSAEGGGELRLQLYPRSLGAIQVHVTVADGAVHGVLSAESAEAAETLTQALPALRRALEAGGIAVATLELASDWQQPAGDRRAGEGAHDHRSSTGGPGEHEHAPSEADPTGDTILRPRPHGGSSAVDVLA